VYPTGNEIQDSSVGNLIEIGDVIAVKDNILCAKCPSHTPLSHKQYSTWADGLYWLS
jgi:hypothetical protein